MLDSPTAEELNQLETGVPVPEPEVLAKAQEIVKEVVGGKTFSDVAVNLITDISDTDKLSFLAHVLGKKAFKKTYKLLDGKLKLTFTSITMETDKLVTRYTLDEEKCEPTATAENRVNRYGQYIKLAALEAIEIDGINNFKPPFTGTFQLVQSALVGLTHMPKVQYMLILKYAEYFNKLLGTLLEQASNDSFWKTL
jgi:hypothetical protein